MYIHTPSPSPSLLSHAKKMNAGVTEHALAYAKCLNTSQNISVRTECLQTDQGFFTLVTE